MERGELRGIIEQVIESECLVIESSKPNRQELDIAADDVARTLEVLSGTVNRLLKIDFGDVYSKGIYLESADAVASLQQVMAAVKKVRDSTPVGYRDDIGTRMDQYGLDQKRLARRTPRKR